MKYKHSKKDSFMSMPNTIRFLASAIMVIFLNVVLYAAPYYLIKADKLIGDPGDIITFTIKANNDGCDMLKDKYLLLAV